jgi:Domain of unknown function (DUF4249)
MQFMRTLCAALLTVSAMGCERIVTVSAPVVTTRLVVEARLERVRGAVTGAQRIRLSTTSPYFAGSLPPAARGAIVRVADDSGRVVPFTESTTEPGSYATTALIIAPGRAYTLRITWQGQEYTATERTQAGVTMDSLYFTKRSAAGAVTSSSNTTGLRATITVRDPVGVANFYLWDQYVDGTRLIVTDTSLFVRPVASDELFDGFVFEDFQPYDGITVKSGQMVRVRQVSISKQIYRFYLALQDQGFNDGSPFGLPPASLRGNVANVTTPSNLALGYFAVSEVTELERRVP